MNTPQRRFWHRFRRSRAAVAGGAFLLLMIAACFASLGWSTGRMKEQNLPESRQPPSWSHPFGTDDLGRSLSARTLYGGALSLSLGLLAAVVAVLIGTTYGTIAGYIGGRLDAAMMRIVDVLYALPTILLVMLLTLSLGAWLERLEIPVSWASHAPPSTAPASTTNPAIVPTPAGDTPDAPTQVARWRLGADWARFLVLAFAIGGVSWLTMARVVRGQVLSLRERPFIEAARALGLPTRRIIFRHILPNIAGPIIVFATLTVPQAILHESFLSFLGVGIRPPQATWGSLAADGVRVINPIAFDWWLVVFPCAALAATLLALNFVGDGLRDALDVRGER